MVQSVEGLSATLQVGDVLDAPSFVQQATALQELAFAQLMMPTLQKAMSPGDDTESEEE